MDLKERETRDIAPRPDPPAAPDPYGLDEARQLTVRLTISIPVLTLLLVLAVGTVLYAFLKVNQSNIITPESRAVLNRTERVDPNFSQLKLEIENADSNLERAALVTLLLSIGLSLVAAVIGYVLARQIVKPIKELTGTMEALAEGDFSAELQPIRLGELGALGSSFNRMVQQLNTLFEERDRQLRESFKGAHLVLDEAGDIIQADQSVRRIFGLNPTEMIGRNLLAPDAGIPTLRQNPRFLDTLGDLVAHAREGRNSSRSVPVRGATPREQRRYFLSCHQMEGSDGGNTRLLLEVRDISGIGSFYEQIQRADRLAAVGTLATGIAHEIRNPLASIRGMAQLLAESDSQDSSAGSSSSEYHRRIIREVDRLEKLVAEIMNFAQTQDEPPEEVDINEMLREAAESARLRVGDKAASIKLEVEFDETMPRAMLQGSKLRQAFLNLLVNAFQHAALQGSGPVRVQTMHLAVNPQRPIIACITNPGQPIDEQMADRIFEPFYTTKPEGTGLGLPIAYHTVLSNGGLLELECENGEIRFWIRLPKETRGTRSASKIIPRYTTPMGTPHHDSWAREGN